VNAGSVGYVLSSDPEIVYVPAVVDTALLEVVWSTQLERVTV
jgi:hypothetical protein